MRLLIPPSTRSPLLQRPEADSLFVWGGGPSPPPLVFEEGRVQQGFSMFMRATKRAEEAPKSKTLRESEASFHFLVETIATPIFISRGERLHYANHAAEVLTGYTQKELLLMNFRDLAPPDSREPVGLASRCEVRILTKNHEERWLDITATPFDFDGQQSRLISAFDRSEEHTSELQ